MSVTRPIAGSTGKHHSFWAMYSLRMSVWIVPPRRSGGIPFSSAAILLAFYVVAAEEKGIPPER